MSRSMHCRFWLALILSAFGVECPTAQTSPQRLFDWTDLNFEPQEYAGRRARLIEALRGGESAGGGVAVDGGVIVIPAADGGSGGETFRQLDDFEYFTGLELPNSVLAIDVAEGAVTLFVPTHDVRFSNPARRNDFPGRRLGVDPALVTRSGIDDIRSIRKFDEALARWSDSGTRLWVRPARGGDGWRRAASQPAAIERADPIRTLVRYVALRHPGLQIDSAYAAVAALRLIKSPAEIDVLRRASEITCAGIRAAARRVAPGVSERALEGVLESEFKRQGSQRVAFGSIVKSGPNSLWPWRLLAAHYDRRNRALQDGELVIFDVGCELDHYVSDVGRTIPVGGTFTLRQRELLTMVTRAADAVIAAVKPGMTLVELQQVARKEIPSEHQRYMQTGLFFGHHVGLEIAEPALSHVPLQPGMVLTVEPWYYNHDEDIAVFVEDMVLVVESGVENLTASLPRTPAELESLTDAASSPPTAQRLTLMAYNVKHGAGMDDRVDLTRSATVIRRVAPDFVALQEIDVGTQRTDRVDQAMELGRLTGMFPMFGKFMDYSGGGYGMALLSRLPVAAWQNYRLPDGAEPRSALGATVLLDGAVPMIRIVGIHLYATEAERLAQAETLIELFAEDPVPTILIGDFNSRPGSPVMDLLGRHWREADKRGDSFTFPSDVPDHEIDFVMLPADCTWSVVDCYVVEEPLASDHRPVVAVIELK